MVSTVAPGREVDEALAIITAAAEEAGQPGALGIGALVDSAPTPAPPAGSHRSARLQYLGDTGSGTCVPLAPLPHRPEGSPLNALVSWTTIGASPHSHKASPTSGGSSPDVDNRPEEHLDKCPHLTYPVVGSGPRVSPRTGRSRLVEANSPSCPVRHR